MITIQKLSSKPSVTTSLKNTIRFLPLLLWETTLQKQSNNSHSNNLQWWMNTNSKLRQGRDRERSGVSSSECRESSRKRQKFNKNRRNSWMITEMSRDWLGRSKKSIHSLAKKNQHQTRRTAPLLIGKLLAHRRWSHQNHSLRKR